MPYSLRGRNVLITGGSRYAKMKKDLGAWIEIEIEIPNPI